jgi:hypothetical protein
MLYLDKGREWSSLAMDGQGSLNLKPSRGKSPNRLGREDDCGVAVRVEELGGTQVDIPFLEARVDCGRIED